MNEAEVKAVPAYGGFEGHFKKVHRCDWLPVSVNGVPQIYSTKAEAENAAYKALMKHLFGDGIVRDGEKASKAKDAANAVFRKGRKIDVARR